MEQTLTDDIAAIMAKEAWSAEDHKELTKLLSDVTDASGRLRAALSDMEAANPQPKGAVALKIGIARYMACRFKEALEALTDATDNKDRRYFQGLCYKNLRQYDAAAEEFERAKDRGWEAVEIDLELVELKALAGNLEAAEKALARLETKAGQRAEYHYLRGLIDELAGRIEQAQEAYLRARAADPNYAPATFRLAYFYDLHGEEEEAVKLYHECLSHPPVFANALMNLAVLYEDGNKYDQAAACLRRILTAMPNHPRARLFFKDVEASLTMFYDEDQAKRVARRNAVLDIPVTDFELSVRARNCLKKMNVGSLGDLVRTTEAELLAYKNFGETSLREIKEMLSIKGLHLGQALEEGGSLGLPKPPAPPEANEGMLATPVEQIEFSVRARKAIESLGVKTLGDLAARTDAELLACKNFGQTSLNEVRQRLAEFGLQLREPG